jgi:hypothetical protein
MLCILVDARPVLAHWQLFREPGNAAAPTCCALAAAAVATIVAAALA